MTDQMIFNQVYLDFHPRLTIYGYTMTDEKQVIEDTIQELFLHIWEVEKLKSIHSIDTYLFVAFRNNLIRKLNRARSVPFERESVASKQSNMPASDNSDLDYYLNQLPKHQKEVIFLRYFENKSYQEISETMGIKYQVARNFAYRAVKYLRRKLIRKEAKIRSIG